MEHKGRIIYFDWIRGTMILWMLVYHISLNYGKIKFGVPEEGASVFTMMSFFMATFYVGTGYFFNTNKEFRTFLCDKLHKIGIPYITFSIWGIIIFELYCLVTIGEWGDLNLIGGTISTGAIRANGPLWFLFSLFFCNILYYWISGGGRFKNIIILMCIIIACATHDKMVILGYGNILMGLSFIHLGTYLRQIGDILKQRNVFLLAFPVFIIVAFFAPQRLEFVSNILVQGNWILNYAYTVLACFLLWYISQLWMHENIIGKGLIYLGENSLVIFAFHRPVLNWIVDPLLRFLNPSISYWQFLIICLCCLLLLYMCLNYILRKFFPVLLGLSCKSL